MSSAPGTVIGVNAFATVQAAVDAAMPGDTVNLAAGTYSGPLTLPRSIILSGAGSGATILEGQGAGIGVDASGPGIVLRGLTIRGFQTGLIAGKGTTYLALSDVHLVGNAYGGDADGVATVLVSGSGADETFFVRPGLVARQGDNALAVSGVRYFTLDGGGGKDRLAVYLNDTNAPDTVWLASGAVARAGLPFVMWYRSSGGTFGGGVAVVLGDGEENVVVQGQLVGAPTTVYGGAGSTTFNVAVPASASYADLTLDGGAGSSRLAVFNTSGGAPKRNAVSGAGQGEVDFAYSDGAPSRIRYQNLEQVLGDLPGA